MPSNADPSFQTAASTVSALVSKASHLCTGCGTANVAGLIDAVSSLGGSSSATGTPSNPLASTNDPTPEVPVDQSVLPDVPKITVQDLTSGQSPSPTTTPTEPKVKSLTDPLVGALLGDEEQQGVVPKLLDQLLTPKQ